MPRTRNQVFDRVELDFLVRGAVTVRWDIFRKFWDPQPYVFQVQVRREGDQVWQNAGPTTQSAQITIAQMDPDGRQGWVAVPLVGAPKTGLVGTDRRVEFRVHLNTPYGDYYSNPARPLGEMQRRMWLIAREIIRRPLVSVQQKGMNSFRGHLWKHKMHGEACSHCLDTMTGECLNSDCEHCMGTGILKGFWKDIEVPMLDISGHNENRNVVEERGTVDMQRMRKARFVGPVFPENHDVWQDYGSDRRYAIGDTKVVAHLNGVPLISDVTLRELEHDDHSYLLTST